MKKIVFLLLVLLVGSVSASDVLLTRAQYRVQMRRNLGTDTTNVGYLSDAAANSFLSEALLTVLPSMGVSKQIQTITTTFRETTYGLDTLTTAVLAVWWEKADTLKPLRRVPIDKWGEFAHNTTTGSKDNMLKRPSLYDVTDSLLILYPPPHIVGDTIRVLILQNIGDIASLDTLSVIPERYRATVLNYATWRAAAAREDPRASMFAQMFMSTLNANTGAEAVKDEK